MIEKPRHKFDYVDCLHRHVCWEVGEYGTCGENPPCEDYVKISQVVIQP